MSVTPPNFNLFLRFDSLDALRLVNQAFNEAVDKVLQNHPLYFMIHAVRRANYLAFTLSDQLTDNLTKQKELDEKQKRLSKRLSMITRPSLPKPSLPSIKSVPKAIRSSVKVLSDITTLSINLYQHRGTSQQLASTSNEIKTTRDQFLEARNIREEYTPLLRLYEMERCVIELFGGQKNYDSLPQLKIDFNLIADPLPLDKIVDPVMVCEDRYGEVFITLKFCINITCAGTPLQEEVYCLFHKGSHWSTKFISGKRILLGELNLALACLFQYNEYSVNLISFRFCYPFLEKVRKGKLFSVEELMNAKIPRTSDLRTISLVAKKGIYS